MLQAARHALILLVALSPGLLRDFHRGSYELAPLSEAQVAPGRVARFFDPIWRWISELGAQEAQGKWRELKRQLDQEASKLPRPGQPPVAEEGEVALMGGYGKLPVVSVDIGSGAVFPAPMAAPARFSWYQTTAETAGLLLDLDSLRDSLERWRRLGAAERERSYETLAGRFEAIHTRFVRVASLIRYLSIWTAPSSIPPSSGSWASDLVKLQRDADFATAQRLRARFLPRRAIQPPYLPHSLAPWRGKTILFPIATDITDLKFLREVEGALDTHWNRSPWARRQGIRFEIGWRKVPGDLAFAMGVIPLVRHLEKFPEGPAVITTGGLATHVRARFLILGPERISARTLAHELGHLMGFEDCYSRSLSSQGIFGLAVLEWANPFFPDELMCDNSVGVAHQMEW